jgi:hypothetical protein
MGVGSESCRTHISIYPFRLSLLLLNRAAASVLLKVESGPLGREQCAGEPVLRRWSSPRFIRHSGLADTAHRTDFRVEPLFMNVGSTSVDHPPALQAVFYCGVYGYWPGIASLVRSRRIVVVFQADSMRGIRAFSIDLLRFGEPLYLHIFWRDLERYCGELSWRAANFTVFHQWRCLTGQARVCGYSPRRLSQSAS